MPWIAPPNRELYPAISDHAIRVITFFVLIKYVIPNVESEGLGWESEGLGWESEGLGWESEGLGWESEGLGWPLFHFY